MVSKDAVIPIATLSTIVVVGVLFIAWWFPRTWNKGNAQERAIIDEERRERDTYLATLRAEQKVNRTWDEEAGEDRPPEHHAEPQPPPYAVTKPRGYVPQVTMY